MAAGMVRREGDRPKMKTIILCATQRCGSTMIVEDMRACGFLGQPREYFIAWARRAGPDRDTAGAAKPGPEPDWQARLAQIRRKSSGGGPVGSVKVMARQLPGIEAALASFAAPAPQGPFPHVAAVFADAAWIYLTRRDAVAQAISREMARQTGINHATRHAADPHFAGNLLKGYRSDYNAAARYDYAAIRRQVASIALENALWHRFFAAHGIAPLRLEYEATATQGAGGIVRAVADHAGIAVPAGLAVPERRMVKLSNALNAEWEQRFLQDMVAREMARR